MSHCQAGAARSKASSPSSASAVRNWIGEERIAASLLLHQLRQGPRMLRLAMQGIGDEPADIVEPEGRQARFPEPARRHCGSPRACASADARGRPRCPGRRRSASGAAPRSASPDARGSRASRYPATANRRGTAQAGARAGRTRRGSDGTPSGSGFAHPAAADRGPAVVCRSRAPNRG